MTFRTLVRFLALAFAGTLALSACNGAAETEPQASPISHQELTAVARNVSASLDEQQIDHEYFVPDGEEVAHIEVADHDWPAAEGIIEQSRANWEESDDRDWPVLARPVSPEELNLEIDTDREDVN